MNKMILVIALAALCSGCSQSTTDTAKIDALSQKLDLICSNQTILFGKVQTIESQVTNLPDLKRLDGMEYYYRTNEIERLGALAHFYHTNEMGKLDEMSAWEYLAATNQQAVTKGEADLILQSIELSTELEGLNMTNIDQLNSDLTGARSDVRLIKARLGILDN